MLYGNFLKIDDVVLGSTRVKEIEVPATQFGRSNNSCAVAWTGIIKKTRTVMECMHRFCRGCIDKSMRLGNNECPACRTHCASRRSLRDDPRYDELIECLYPDIEKYEEEELTFHEEERTRNNQIQASIAQIFRRQSEALVRRRTLGKDTAASSSPRLPRNYRNAYSIRRRRSSRSTEIQGSDDNGDENDHDGNKNSSSTDEHETEIKPRSSKRRTGGRPSPSAANSDGGCIENEIEAGRESRGISPGVVWSPEMLAWGRGGARSHTRHGSASSSKVSRSTRLSKLVDYLRSLQENDDKYVAHETPLEAKDVKMVLVKETSNTTSEQSAANPLTSMDDPDSLSRDVSSCKAGLQVLEEQETLAGLKANSTSSRDLLILAYRQKGTS